ncbi:MAG: sodium:calcium antiporter [Chloroflexi bacterium]|nr:sodium:calcium antiporter [Chloroflexota bacterium]
MGLIGDLALLAVAFAIILAGAELFTNGIEWLGDRLGLSEGMVGSVLAAVGTAMPETMIPIIAILFVGTQAAEEVGIGAILGAPFLLSTAAMFVTGVAVLIYHRRGRRKSHLVINQVVVGRDLRFFLGMYTVAIGMGLPFFDKPVALRIAVGIALILAYVWYVRRTASDPKSESSEQLGLLHLTKWGLQPKAVALLEEHGVAAPDTRSIVIQVFISLVAIVVGAQIFVDKIQSIASTIGVAPLILSLIIAPLATELPEKFNSVIWIRQRKDTLAMGNISGAMVFQSCIPAAIGIVFTPWVLNEFALASAVIAIGAGILMQIYLRTGNVITGRELVSVGVFYFAFILWVVAFPHTAPPPLP